jgi:hypothetical protein
MLYIKEPLIKEIQTFKTMKLYLNIEKSLFKTERFILNTEKSALKIEK